MKQKPSILIWADSPTINTGFGIVTRNLFSDLHKFADVSIVGINEFGTRRYDHTLWHIYPVQKNEPVGYTNIVHIAKKLQPEVIILFQDLFHIRTVINAIKQESPNSKILSYFPVDGGPLCVAWEPVIQDSDIVITYTQYGVDRLQESFLSARTKKIYKLLHGIAPEFHLLDETERDSIRQTKGWNDRFVVINNNRLQPRKNIPATLRVWSMFSKGYKVCDCGNHYPKHLEHCDANHCDSSHVVERHEGRDDVTLYLHMRFWETSLGPKNGPHFLQNMCLVAGFNDTDMKNNLIKLIDRDQYQDPYTKEEMNEFYNGADVNISTAVGEGFGLSLGEALATGTTSIAPSHSSIPEVLGNTGIIVRNLPNALYTHSHDNSFTRPIVDTVAFRDALIDQYNLWEKNGRKKIVNEAAIEHAQKNLRWDDKKAFIEAKIRKLIS